MTEKIKSAIDFLQKRMYSTSKEYKMAIRSLKAWEEVLQELEELKQKFKNDRNIQGAIAVNISIKRIKEHLVDVKE